MSARLRVQLRMPARRGPSRSNAPSTYTDASRGPRLQRALADAGVASRRACESLIEQGLVTVNGHLVDELPAWIDPEQDRVVVDGKVVEFDSRRIYVMLNKPTRTITTTRDEPDLDRRTVVDLVDHPAAERLFPVGRLDFDTTGLVLLTNDGELANKLTHPRFGVAKTYRALVKGRLSDEDVERLAEGIYLAERKAGETVGAQRASHVGLRVSKRDRDKTTLEITLKEGRNRQVRRMLAAVGCPVKKLERIAMGPVKLSGLARGAWRELQRKEVEALRRAVRGSGRPAKPEKASPDQQDVPSRVDRKTVKRAVAMSVAASRERRDRRSR